MNSTVCIRICLVCGHIFSNIPARQRGGDVSGIDPDVGRLCSVALALKWKFCLEDCDLGGTDLFTAES